MKIRASTGSRAGFRIGRSSFLFGILIVTVLPALDGRGMIPMAGGARAETSKPYLELNKRLLAGWNTWDAENVLSAIFLPDGMAITLEIESRGRKIAGPHLGQNEIPGLDITPGGHAYDGSYSEMTIHWQAMAISVQTAAEGRDIDILVSNDKPGVPATLTIIPEMKWGRPGTITREGSVIRAKVAGKVWNVRVSGPVMPAGTEISQPRLAVSLSDKVGLSTRPEFGLEQIENSVAAAREKHERRRIAYGDRQDIYDALQSVLAWNTVYDEAKARIITPVSRSWCYGNGFVLFEWDTYFACYMLSLDNKDLAYANLMAITKEITPGGFVPNVTTKKNKSSDRSQPPVGSMVVKTVYQRHRDKWILEALFPDLLSWNRWWARNRDWDGYLCWGSDPIPIGPETGTLDKKAIHQLLGAKFESGLDDSPMYDDVSFDPRRNLMGLADVGLMSLYIMDCRALADIAGILKNPSVEKELRDRAARYARALETLWDEKTGLYLNKNLSTGELSRRKSPTLFYPLLARVPSRKKAERMIKEHFYNPKEFWGDWVLPSIARDDPAYSDTYWRGRIWGPMNFLVYLGLCNYDLGQARADLAARSRELLLQSWRKSRTVHENYNPFNGAGTSDDYYHWGALLGFMTFIEDRRVRRPESPR